MPTLATSVKNDMETKWTKRLVMVTILAEVIGRPQAYTQSVIDACLPRCSQADDEMSESEALDLLDKLRKEKSGILNWLAKGRRDALALIEEMASRN